MLNVIIIIILNPYHAGRLRTVIKEFIKGTFNILNLFFHLWKIILIHTQGEGELQDSLPRLNVEKLAICPSHERQPERIVFRSISF